jgi:hypothetical protein
LAGLVKEIDKVVEANEAKKLASVVNFIGSDSDALKTAVKEFAEKCETKSSALVVPNDAQAGPRNYSISEDADVTVIFYERQQVKVNRALKGDQLTAETAKKIAAEVAAQLQ